MLNLKLETCRVDLKGLQQSVQVLVNVFFLHFFFVVERNAVVGVDPADHAEEETVAGSLQGRAAQALQ